MIQSLQWWPSTWLTPCSSTEHWSWFRTQKVCTLPGYSHLLKGGGVGVSVSGSKSAQSACLSFCLKISGIHWFLFKNILRLFCQFLVFHLHPVFFSYLLYYRVWAVCIALYIIMGDSNNTKGRLEVPAPGDLAISLVIHCINMVSYCPFTRT